MAILGLTDQRPKLPKLGTLRKGAAKPERGPGKDLDHFRFDTEDATAQELFKAVYGDKPRCIRVILPHATVDENWEAWKEHWVKSALKHRCDGKTCVLHLKSDGTYSTDPIPCPGGCKQVGRLTVIVPELKRLASVTVLTTSINDIIEIQGNLDALALNGQVRGIPLLLRRVKRMISTKRDDGQRARADKWLLNIEAQPQWFDLALGAAENAARALAQGKPMMQLNPAPVEALQAGDFDDEDLGEIVPPGFAVEDGPAPARATVERITQADCPIGLGIDAGLIAWAIKEKKSEKAGQAYFDGVMSRWPSKQKEDFAKEKGIKWTDAPVIEVKREPDEIDAEMSAALDELDAACQTLIDAGLSAEEVQAEVIRLLPEGLTAKECTPRQVDEIITGLNLKLASIRKAA